MRLLSLAHSILDHLLLVLSFSGPCLWAPGWGEPGFRGGLCPALVVFLLLPVIQDVVVASSHCFTCKTGFAQIHEMG